MRPERSFRRDGAYLPAGWRAEQEETVVACRGVTKRFGGQVAVDDVDFDLRAGEVHALVGENGAGKSTLVKMLDGYHRPDEGDVLVGDEEVRFASVRDAERAGVAMIPQELDLFGELTVAENLVVGRDRPRRPWGGIDWNAIRAAARERFETLGVDVDVDAPVKQLSTANQQLVAIARALAGDARAVIMDEPTSSLSGDEVERLFGDHPRPHRARRRRRLHLAPARRDLRDRRPHHGHARRPPRRDQARRRAGRRGARAADGRPLARGGRSTATAPRPATSRSTSAASAATASSPPST